MTLNIASPSGRRSAPADILIEIAHGLATRSQWWRLPLDQRGFATPIGRTIEEVRNAYRGIKDDLDYLPMVTFTDDAMTWRPFASPGKRFVTIHVEDGANEGWIEWDTGTDEPSSFIGGMLRLLPNAVDNGNISAHITAEDKREARRVAKARSEGRTTHMETGFWIRSVFARDGTEFQLASRPSHAEREQLIVSIDLGDPEPAQPNSDW